MSTVGEVKVIAASAARSSVFDYVELMKLRLVTLVLITTGVGFTLGYAGPVDGIFFVHLARLILGTGLVAAGAMALNQYMERDTDALMHRTMGRPVPTGRISPVESLLFGSTIGLVGILYLYLSVNELTAMLAFVTIASYLFFYTPLKTRTPLCTIVGAVPGAIPPMMGCVAARGSITSEAWALFAILFVWQMPHFLAIAWLYRADYARGRQMMLPVVDPSGRQTARQIISFTLTLLPATLMPTVIGMAGPVYFGVALTLGLVFLAFGVILAIWRTQTAARQMFLASVLYLPLLLGLMVFDRLPA